MRKNTWARTRSSSRRPFPSRPRLPRAAALASRRARLPRRGSCRRRDAQQVVEVGDLEHVALVEEAGLDRPCLYELFDLRARSAVLQSSSAGTRRPAGRPCARRGPPPETWTRPARSRAVRGSRRAPSARVPARVRLHLPRSLAPTAGAGRSHHPGRAGARPGGRHGRRQGSAPGSGRPLHDP
jgi:hypothetical protein